ncbi:MULTISPECIES: hypothetical protein [unclassified Nonomuraea]|uniref:hypothetical protein n=1 Tax=unclassified Nonomuraea TaxID=2593643 RepID=UPI0033D8A53C
MAKGAGGQERSPGSWVWRAVRIAAIVVLGVSLLAWFLVDPLDLPGDLLEELNQRASVIGMFTGAGGLIVSMLGLRVQQRSRPVDDIASTTGTPGPGQAKPARARGPRRRTVLLTAAVPAVMVALIVLAVVRNAPVRYEAEDGTYHKANIIHVDGTSNNAVMGHLNFPDSWVEIKVYAPRAGTYTVNLRYRVGEGDARQYLTVNGSSTKRLVDYPDHDHDGKWNSWSNLSIKLTLNHEWNTLRFQHDDGPFAAELDYVEIA